MKRLAGKTFASRGGVIGRSLAAPIVAVLLAKAAPVALAAESVAASGSPTIFGPAERAAVGFALVEDTRTGVRVGLPLRLIGRAVRVEGGSRRVSRDGRIEYRFERRRRQDLAALFERLTADGTGRGIERAELTADGFTVVDRLAGRHGLTRFVRHGDGVRGFTVRFDPSLETSFAGVAEASLASFDGAPVKSDRPETVPTATGLAVAPGRAVVAAAAVDGCREVRVADRPVAVAGLDATRTLALLSWAEQAGVSPLRFAEAPTTAGEPLVLAVARPTTTVAVGRATATGVRTVLAPGGFSAPVFDAAGRLAGLLADRPAEADAAGRPVDHPLIGASVLAAFVGRPGPASTVAPSAGSGVRAVLAARLVGVVCVR